MKNLDDISIIPLRDAVLCVNCNTASNANGPFCPACGSPSLFNLSVLLDREEPVSMFELVRCDA